MKYKNFGNIDFKLYAIIFLIWELLIIYSLGTKNLYSTDRMLTIPKEFYQVGNALLYPSVVIAALIFVLKLKFYQIQQNSLQ